MENIKIWQGYTATRIHIQHCWEYKLMQSFGKLLYRTKECRQSLRCRNSIPMYIPKRNASMCSPKDIHQHGCSCTLHCCCLVTESCPTLSMGFPRQEYWSVLLVPSPGHLPDPGIELASLSQQGSPSTLNSSPQIEISQTPTNSRMDKYIVVFHTVKLHGEM